MKDTEVLNLDGAYPRPRGGAGYLAGCPMMRTGLSPPARGSLPNIRAFRGASRPIPARAGEPRHGARAGPPPEAYPRPRGGATVLRVVTA